VKKTPLTRKTPLRQKKPMSRSGRVKPRSTKTIAEMPERARVRATVLARDRICRGRGLTPVDCAAYSTDVHELKRGAHRRDCYLDPAKCVGLCRPCHQWVTEHPSDARPLGLALRSGDPFPDPQSLDIQPSRP
jgi:hypothetical protein